MTKRSIAFLGAALLVGLAPPAARAADWPMMQRDSAHSGSTDSGPEPPLRLSWKALPPGHPDGAFTTAPVVLDGAVYASSGDGILAVGAETGETLWFAEPDGGQAIVSPAVDDRLLYMPLRGNRVVALDRLTGEERWRFDTDKRVDASPTISAGLLFLAAAEEKVLYCLDAATGELIWRADHDLEPYTTPAVAGGDVFYTVRDLSTDAAYLISRAATDGQENWRVRQSESASAPAIFGKAVVVGTGDLALNAYDVESGRHLWSAPLLNLVGERSIPAVAFGDVFVVDRVGNRYRFDGATGNVEWSFRYDGGTFSSSSPVIAGSTLYVGGHDGLIHAYDVDTGREVWSISAGGAVDSGAVDGARLYVGARRGNSGIHAYESNPDAGSTTAGEQPAGESGLGLGPWLLGGAFAAGLSLVLGVLRRRRGRSTDGNPGSARDATD